MLPIRMNAAETRASRAIADWMALTSVPRSATTAEIETFMIDVSTTSTNMAIARRIGRRLSPVAAGAAVSGAWLTRRLQARARGSRARVCSPSCRCPPAANAVRGLSPCRSRQHTCLAARAITTSGRQGGESHAERTTHDPRSVGHRMWSTRSSPITPTIRLGVRTSLEIEPVHGAPVGTRIHQVIKGPGGRGLGADIEITANEPSARYAFQVVAGPVHPRGDFRFSPAGSGSEVSFSLATDLEWLSRSSLCRAAVQRSMDGEMAGLDTAKRLIESS